MHTTITIDDTLYRRTLELSDPQMDYADVLPEAMMTYMRVQTGKGLSVSMRGSGATVNIGKNMRVPAHGCIAWYWTVLSRDLQCPK